MAQYIDKDALVAEIEKRFDEYSSSILKHYDACTEARASELGKILIIINTLEVKEDDNFLNENKIEKELAESYINLFDKKFGNKLPNLKNKQLAEFKNFINTCEQTFHMKYFDYHAIQGKLFEKLALLWAVWGKEHFNLEVKEVDLEKELEMWMESNVDNTGYFNTLEFAKHFFELGLKSQKGE